MLGTRQTFINGEEDKLNKKVGASQAALLEAKEELLDIKERLLSMLKVINAKFGQGHKVSPYRRNGQ